MQKHLDKVIENGFYAMLQNMTRFITITLFMLLTTFSIAAEPEKLQSNEWLLPKKAGTILSMPAIYNSMLKIQKSPNSILSLKYPGGDEGTLWANELRSWLVTLGLSSKRIMLVQGSAISTSIEFEVSTPKVRNEDILTKEKI